MNEPSRKSVPQPAIDLPAAAFDRRFQAMVERSLEGIALFDRDGVVRYASPAITRILGYTPEELIGHPVLRFVHPDDLEAVQPQFEKIMQHPGATTVTRCRDIHKDGSYRWVESTVTNLLDDPDVGAIVSNVRDITDSMRVQAELAAALRDSENIVKTIPDVLYRLDLHGRVTKWNRKAEQITGWRDVDVTGRSALEFFASDDRPQVAAAIADVFAKGFGQVEARMCHRDGTLIPYHYTGVPLRDENGAIVGMTGIGRDVTERQRTERQMAALLEVATTIAGTLDIDELLERVQRQTALVLPCDGTVVFKADWQDGVSRVIAQYGLPAELVADVRRLRFPLGQPFGGRLTGGQSVLVNDLQGQSWLPEIFRDRVPLSSMIAVPLLVHGHSLGALACFNSGPGRSFAPDQTELARGIAQQLAVAMEAAELYRKQQQEAAVSKALAQHNARLVRELERANRLKSDFVATMSHELRTPLNIILGYNDLVLEGEFGPLMPEQREALERVESSARTLLELITATLDMSRLESGRLPVQIDEVVVGDLIQELDREVRELYEDKPRVQFDWQLCTPLPVLQTDRMKLKVILKNLIGNAIKFTDNGRIEVAVSLEESELTVRVSDSGIGIAPDMLEIIFEPFRQVDSSTTRRHAGVGLGLHIVRRLVELLGGRISVESTPKQGSTFNVALPLQHPSLAME